jgi:hypothetical protein
MFTAVPSARPIPEEVVAERTPGPADNAEVEKRNTSSLYSAAASGAGFLVRRLSRRRLDVTLEPGRWRYQLRLGLRPNSAIMLSALSQIAP